MCDTLELSFVTVSKHVQLLYHYVTQKGHEYSFTLSLYNNNSFSMLQYRLLYLHP